MAITKERIDELIKNRAKIYGISKSGEVFCLGLKFREHTLNNKKWLENKYEVYSKFYENKEDAEFVAKYHTSRVEKFEPPAKLGLNERYDFVSKKGARMSIWQNFSKKWWLCYCGTHKEFDTYEESVEKARKLFLGESDE